MSRNIRQSKILELIAKYEIDTQDDLSSELKKAGFTVTQATVSRDIKELGLVKVQSGEAYKYAVPAETAGVSAKIINMFRESVISIDGANNLIVIKTMPGSANAAALLVDKLNINGVMGCIAGDDTVLVILKTDNITNEVVRKLQKLME